ALIRKSPEKNMKLSARLALFVVAVLFAAVETKAQEGNAVRPRVVGPVAQQQTTTKTAPSLPVVVDGEPQNKTTAGPVTFLTPSVIKTRISDAQRMLKTRPKPTALSVPQIEWVTIAALDRDTARTHFITISKQTFLTKGAEINTITSENTNVTVRIVRANGVNTAMTIVTPDGKSLAPLTIEYPIERGGKFLETAYYTSAHPALLSNDLVRSGQGYVRN